MTDTPSLLLLDRIWPPFHERIRSLCIAAAVLGAFGLFQLGIRYAVPSDPCAADDVACISSDRAWLTAGLIALLVAGVLLAIAAWLLSMRRRMSFVVPPGWPLPPPGWRPTVGWEPDPDWPVPSDWEFWRRPR